MLRVGAFLPRAAANGPGLRAVVWVQGCGRGCPGCRNTDLQSVEGGRLWRVDELGAAIGTIEGIEGMTFSGGEPFAQATALTELARCARAVRDLGVVCYTGYTYEELVEEGPEGADGLLQQTDLLIDGPYLEDEAAPLLWRGSSNQRLVFLSDRYKGWAWAADAYVAETEVSIVGERVTATGCQDEAALDEVCRLLHERSGVTLQ